MKSNNCNIEAYSYNRRKNPQNGKTQRKYQLTGRGLGFSDEEDSARIVWVEQDSLGVLPTDLAVEPAGTGQSQIKANLNKLEPVKTRSKHT